MLRTGYTARVRPWRDADGSVEIRWFQCKPGAPALPYPSVIRSLHWESHPYLFAAGRGEVFNALSRVYPFKAPAGLDGSHPPCGTERDFSEGGEYLPDVPPVPVTLDGVPLCCAPEPGGVVLSGSGVAGRGVSVTGGLGGYGFANVFNNAGPMFPLSSTLMYTHFSPFGPGPGLWWGSVEPTGFPGRTYRLRIANCYGPPCEIRVQGGFGSTWSYTDSTPRTEWDVTFTVTDAFQTSVYVQLSQTVAFPSLDALFVGFMEDVTP